jgi:hypothetical protein
MMVVNWTDYFHLSNKHFADQIIIPLPPTLCSKMVELFLMITLQQSGMLCFMLFHIFQNFEKQWCELPLAWEIEIAFICTIELKLWRE